jgi:hypothetical protein
MLERHSDWDLQPAAAARPSRLYGLKPIGLGTPFVESLSGFFKRLSGIHCVTPPDLFREVIGPVAKTYLRMTLQQSPVKAATLTRSFSARSMAINGTGIMAEEWIGMLERATEVSDLRSLTFRPWTNILSQRNLLRSHLGWCPVCYYEWREKRKLVYEPLIWSLQSVTVCLKHKSRLQLRCRHCRKSLFAVSRCGEPGYCSECGGWLGEKQLASLRNRLTDNELAWQVHTIETVGKLFAACPGPVSLFSCPDTVGKAISHLMRGTNQSLTELAEVLGKPKTTVWGWRNKEGRMVLDDLLRVCFCFATSPIDFLLLRPATRRRRAWEPLDAPRSRGQRGKRARCKPLPKEKMERRLTEILKRKVPPRSLQATAHMLNIDKRLLYKHFSELSRAIAARGAAFRGIQPLP